MAEISDAEINVEELKSRIREAVARREAEGTVSFINASAELHRLLSTDELSIDGFSLDDSALDYFPVDGFPASSGEIQSGRAAISRFTLQPEFTPRDDDRYEMTELLLFHDAAFVWNAYRALLKREPDETGFRKYLDELRSGRLNKIDILASLRFSPEGRSKKVHVAGLALPSIIRRAYRLPLIGYLLELTVGLARLPVMLRSQRQMENHLIAQQERIVGYINGANQQLADQINIGRELLERLNRMNEEMQDYIRRVNQNTQEHMERVNQAHLRLADSFSLGLNELSGRQKELARLQHEQVAALFREQREIIEDQKRMKDAGPAPALAPVQTAPADGPPLPQSPQSPSKGTERPSMDKLYASFEDCFRGTAEEVRQGLGFYLPLLEESGIKTEVLDIGCGRGEWLELLREEGISGRGVEANSVMAERCRARGLEVIEADAIAHLRGLPSDSLQAISAFHLIEHLDFDALIELLDEALRVLRPGGLVMFETPNPKNLVVGACNFYSDPTHRRPLFPETIQFILSDRGFARVRLSYLHPVEGSPFTARDQGSQMLHSWFFSPRDFAVIGWKEST
ncbi:MAG TPA: methyltransferase domain-containing protein [Pyrinomonadaceae bacterium]|jgi:O-antigen chain-terminating methyltransferase|nr:methyltransferase domain-containing protein [Pyrinomonadaceae bacterium]